MRRTALVILVAACVMVGCGPKAAFYGSISQHGAVGTVLGTEAVRFKKDHGHHAQAIMLIEQAAVVTSKLEIQSVVEVEREVETAMALAEPPLDAPLTYIGAHAGAEAYIKRIYASPEPSLDEARLSTLMLGLASGGKAEFEREEID